jgi:hypothetical protein
MPDGFCYEVTDPSASTTTQEGLAWYTTCIACASATSPSPSPTPAPVVSTYYYLIDRCDGSSGTYTELASTSILSPGTSVKMDDGFCYEVQDAVGVINSNVLLSLIALLVK